MCYNKYMMINFIDYIMLLVIFFFVYVGYNSGFVQELLTLIIWYLSYLLTNRYYYYFLSSIQYFLNINLLLGPSLITVILYGLLLFSFCIILSYFKYWLIFFLYNSTFLLNRILGAFLGLLKGIFFIVLVFSLLNNFLKIKFNKYWVLYITDYLLRKIQHFFGILQ